MSTPIKSYSQLKIGDYYEDCAYHPCICTHISEADDEVQGISLVDGSYPRACSVTHCDLHLLSLEEAISWKLKGPPEGGVPEKKRWW
jgi:hypothetical protein